VAFYVLVSLHAVCALAGFGSIGIAGTYASRAGRLLSGDDQGLEGPEGTEELQRYFARPARLSLAVLAVPVLGLWAAQLRPDLKGLHQAWQLAALAVFGLVMAIYVAAFGPALNELKASMAKAYPTAPRVGGPLAGQEAKKAEVAGRRASAASAACDCLFFVALALMVWQPS
jgi:hypothetical protein